MPRIWGTTGANILRGTAQRDTVWGLDGADTLLWGRGRGNDVYHAGNGGERFDSNPYSPGNPGGDRLDLEGTIGAQIRLQTTENGTATIGNETLTFTGIERIFGTNGADRVFAGAASLNAPHNGTPQHGLSIFTEGGNDRIWATQFDDVINGGSGNDTIRAGAGNDFIHASTGDDLIFGGRGGDNIRWGQGNFNEVIGDDRIFGGAGDDVINVWVKDGYTANGLGVAVDVNYVQNGSMRLTAETDIGGETSTLRAQGFELGWTHEGRDTVSGAEASIAGNEGMNWNTRWGDDILIGTRGNDTLEGGEGRDTIQGGAGNDLISGNGDAHMGQWAPSDGDRDVFVFRGNSGNDTVIGFDAGLDVIDTGGRDYSARETGNGTLLDLAGNNSIFLAGEFDFI